jgi:hypothetical protein
VDLLINDQTIPKIMGKMPFTDWKEWATKQLDNGSEETWGGTSRHMWKENGKMLSIVAAAEPQTWEADTAKRDRGYQEKPAWEKPIGVVRKNTRLAGAANVVTYQSPSGGRKGKFQDFMGCSGNHAMSFRNKLLELDSKPKQRALAACGPCLLCLRHPAGAKCYGRGEQSKPACPFPECDEKRAANVHDVFVGASTSVSLITDEGNEYGDDAFFNVEQEQEKRRTRRRGGRTWMTLGWSWRLRRTKTTIGSSL